MPNERTEILISSFKPELAIMVYKGNERDYYLESHSISENGAILEGKPLLQETMQEIVDVFFDERQNAIQVKGLLPENLLSFKVLPGGNYRMVWFRPAEIRVIHFATPLKLATNKVYVPAMIYVADRKEFYVHALKSNARPKETAKVYKAPFYNVADDGLVCLGNATVKKPKEKTYTSLMQYWEDLFWLSEFTHMNGSNKTKSNMHAIWKKLLASKTKLKWSDVDELIAYQNRTVKNLIK